MRPIPRTLLMLAALVGATTLFWLKAMPDVSTVIIKASPTPTRATWTDPQGNVWTYVGEAPAAEATR